MNDSERQEFYGRHRELDMAVYERMIGKTCDICDAQEKLYPFGYQRICRICLDQIEAMDNQTAKQ